MASREDSAASVIPEGTELYVYWCPECQIQCSRPWHVVERNGLIPQLDHEHDCIRVAVIARG